MNESSDKNDELLRTSINNKKSNKNIWKLIAFIFMALFLICVIVIIILAATKISKESENNNEDKGWSPAGDRIKTKWGKEFGKNTQGLN